MSDFVPLVLILIAAIVIVQRINTVIRNQKRLIDQDSSVHDEILRRLPNEPR